MKNTFCLEDIKLFAGPTARNLVRNICKRLDRKMKPGRIRIKHFADKETDVQYLENIRNKHVIIMQNTGPSERNLIVLLLMIDAAKRSAAAKVTAIIPYFGYSRQERKDRPRTALSCKVMAKAIDGVHPDWLVFCDLHSAAIPGFFEFYSDHVFARLEFLKLINERFAKVKKLLTVVAPDIGSIKAARAYAKRLNAPLAIVDKRRAKHNQSEVINVIGKVKGRICIVIDDIIDTAGTFVGAAKAVHERGAKKVVGFATDALLSGPALERIQKSPLEYVIVSDNVPLKRKAKKCKKIQVHSLEPMWSKVINCLQTGESLSSLFDDDINVIN